MRKAKKAVPEAVLRIRARLESVRIARHQAAINARPMVRYKFIESEEVFEIPAAGPSLDAAGPGYRLVGRAI